MPFQADVFVIGGGPVGLAAAIAARRKGFRVIVADGQRPPIDKACGEGMLPDGLLAARDFGLNLPAADTFTIRGIRFIGEGVSVASDFPRGPGLGVRRTVLHRALTDLAEQSGVELRWGAPVSDLKDANARWIIGADGGNSRVRKLAGLDASVRNTQRYGFRIHFHVPPWSEFIEVHWGPGCQIYVTPISRNEVGIALISRNPKLRVTEALQYFPELSAKLKPGIQSSSERGAVTAMRRLRRVVSGKIALIGDASGSVDAITGEGLTLGFHQSVALAEAMVKGDLASFVRAHRRLARRPRLMAGLLLALDRWPALRQNALPALARHPQLFRRLLAMHVGADWSTLFEAPATS